MEQMGEEEDPTGALSRKAVELEGEPEGFGIKGTERLQGRMGPG